MRDPDDKTCLDGTKKKGRKDLFGITNAIDTFATTALLKNKATAMLQRQQKVLKQAGLVIDTNKYAKDPISNQRLQSVIAGSLRGPDRLLEAGLIESAECTFCGAENATLEHIVWECPHWQKTREPFLQSFNHYATEHMQ